MRTSAMTLVAGLTLLGCNRPVEPGAVVPARPAPAAPEPAPPAPHVQARPAPPTPPPPPTIRHVLIVSEDGLRPDALTEERTPVHAALMRAGTTARVAHTILPSETLPAHASMLSGFSSEDHGMVWDSFDESRGYIEVPTIFSVATEHDLSTAMFVGKAKLEHIARPGSVEHFDRPAFKCSKVVAAATEYLVASLPRLMFVHLTDPDDAGHTDGWMTAGYFEGVERSDRCLGDLLAALDTAGIADSTLVIVTADHGGHDRTHSAARTNDADRLIPWIARGPNVPSDAWIEATVTTWDTAATALDALGLPPSPGMAGVSRLDLR